MTIDLPPATETPDARSTPPPPSHGPRAALDRSASRSRWIHPTRFTGEYPHGWNGYTFLDWSKEGNAYHPADDYNFGFGNDDLGQEVVAVAAGEVVHTSESDKGYGNIVVIRHPLDSDLQRFVQQTYAIETTVLYSLYAHLQDITTTEGSAVEVGTIIGHVGVSGTQWAHLHFEIYAPIPNTGWRFWPTGWTPEQIKRYYLPPYRFIESLKNLETYQQFLGKPAAYWQQIERERQELLDRLQQQAQEWQQKLQEQQQASQVASAALQEELARLRAEVTRLQQVESASAASEQLTQRLQALERENLELRQRLQAGGPSAPLAAYSAGDLALELVRRLISLFRSRR